MMKLFSNNNTKCEKWDESGFIGNRNRHRHRHRNRHSIKYQVNSFIQYNFLVYYFWCFFSSIPLLYKMASFSSKRKIQQKVKFV